MNADFQDQKESHIKVLRKKSVFMRRKSLILLSPIVNSIHPFLRLSAKICVPKRYFTTAAQKTRSFKGKRHKANHETGRKFTGQVFNRLFSVISVPLW